MRRKNWRVVGTSIWGRDYGRGARLTMVQLQHRNGKVKTIRVEGEWTLEQMGAAYGGLA